MAFCPFYDKQCPEANDGDAGCYIWTDFGCCMIDKPGVPAEYSGVSPSIDVFILNIFSEKAALGDKLLVVYSRKSDGVIGESDTLSDFAVHNLR